MQFSHKCCIYSILFNEFFTMNSLLSKEPVKRAEKAIKAFNSNLEIICLERTARTANDAASALGCKVGAIVKSLLFRTGEDFVLCLI